MSALYAALWLSHGLQLVNLNRLSTAGLLAVIILPGTVVGLVWGRWRASVLGVCVVFIVLAPCDPEGSCAGGSPVVGAIAWIAVAATTIVIGVALRRLVGRLAPS